MDWNFGNNRAKWKVILDWQWEELVATGRARKTKGAYADMTEEAMPTRWRQRANRAAKKTHRRENESGGIRRKRKRKLGRRKFDYIF